MSFTDHDIDLNRDNGNDPIMVQAIFGTYMVEKIMVDNDSAVDILMFSTF